MRSAVWAGVDFAVTQGFNLATHDGIDIGCPSGTVIYAARAGVVERVQTGMTSVRVGRQRDFYLHGTSIVTVGQSVAQGQAVIRSGAVQVDPRYPVTGPHLHFEVQDGYTLPGAPPSAPGAPLDPVPFLLGALAFGAAAQLATTQEDDMVFVGPIHKLATVATLKAFADGSYYRAPLNDPRLIGGPVKAGGLITVDSWRYVSTAWASPDVSGAAGAQPGPDFVAWHAITGGWVPDAILDTSKLAGAPAPGIPAAEPMDLYFASREELANVAAAAGTTDDDSQYATKDALAAVAAKVPTAADVMKAIAQKIATA